MKITWILLILITLIAFFLRIYQIDTVPPGLTWDEAALGYNAYSILQTGKDEYGQAFPLILKSFGDYKPALYAYLAIPFIAFFGLSELSVRLPSIILGSFIPLLGFLLAREIFDKEKIKIGIISALLLTISPWLIHFSRGAWEANIALFEILLGLILLLKASSNKKFFIASVILFSVSIFTYQSSKIFALALFFGVLIIKRSAFFKKEYKRLSLGLSVFLVAVFLLSISGSEVRSRLAYLNQLNYPRKEAEIAQIKIEEINFEEFNFNLFHTEILEYIKTVSSRYLNYFSPKFLFSQGAPDGRQGVLDYGVMHLYESIFLIIGFVLLIRNQINDRLKVLILLILFSPIPASLSRDVVSTVRALPLIIPLELLVAAGVVQSINFIKANKYLLFIVPIVVLFILFNLLYYFDRIFTHSRIDSSKYFLGGYKETINFIKDNHGKYKEVYFSTSYKEPYIYYLFYSKYDPSEFQKQAKLVINNPPDVGEVERIDNINFRPVDWHRLRYENNLLLVGTESELPKGEIEQSNQARFLKTIHSPEAERGVIFHIVETY